MRLPRYAHLVRRYAGHRADIVTRTHVYLDVLVAAAGRLTIELEDGTVIYLGDVDHIGPANGTEGRG